MRVSRIIFAVFNIYEPPGAYLLIGIESLFLVNIISQFENFVFSFCDIFEIERSK